MASAGELDLLALELKTYSINILNGLARDVDEQFAKWNKPNVGFLDLLVSAYRDAAKAQASILQDQIDEERRSFDRTLTVLSLLTIGATAWLGSALEMKVGPKIFSEYEPVVGIAWFPAKFGKKITNEFHSKIFGDMFADLAQYFSSYLGQQIAPKAAYQPPNPQSVAYAPNSDAFGQALFIEVERQRSAFQAEIAELTKRINASPTIGQALVNKLVKKYPDISKKARVEMILTGYKMINEDFDDYNRKNWSQWTYYASDPPKPNWSLVKTDFERQLWGIWVLQQHFRKVYIAGIPLLIGASGGVLNTSGGVASEYKENPIVTRLFDLNAPVMAMKQNGSLDDGDDIDEQIKRMKDWATNLDYRRLERQLTEIKRELSSIGALAQ